MVNRQPHRPFLLAFSIVALLFSSAGVENGWTQQQNRANQKAEKKEPIVREIFVPFEELQTVLESDARRVFMTRKEYDQLVKDAVKQAPNEPPHSASVTSAEYQIDLGDGRAAITAELTIEVLKTGRVSLQLPVAGVGVRTAMLDGRSAPLARTKNGASLMLEGRGVHKLNLAMTTAVQTEAAEQTISLELPRGAASKVLMTVPGNIEIKSGADVISRRIDPETKKTYFELVAWSGLKRITMSLNNRRLRDDRSVVCRSVIVDELTEAYERLHITSSFEAMHGAVDQLRFSAPKGWEISEIRSEMLARWSVAEEGDQQIITAQLREPVRGFISLNMLATRTRPDLANWEMPSFRPLDTVGNVAVVGLLLEDRLKPESITASNMLAIDNVVLTAALPESVLNFEPGQPKIRPAFAFYAPQGDYQLKGEIVKPPARLESVSNLLITGSDTQVRVDGAIVLAPGVERRFHVEVTSPADWRITSITDENQKPIAYERLSIADGRALWKLELPKALAPGSEFAVLFQAEPDNSDWLGAWAEKTFAVPRFEVVDADEQKGSIAVQVRDDLAVQPSNIDGLDTLDNRDALERFGDASAALAYRFEGDYTAELLFKREQPYVSGRTYAFLKVEPNRLTTHYELQYTIQQARVRQLRFSLPASTPVVLSIQGARGLAIKGFHSEEVDDQRVWVAELSEPMDGVLSLAVDFEANWEGDPEPTMAPPIARLLDVSYQTSVIAVEGDARLDVQIASDARSVDIGELAASEHVPGRRLLGAYEFIGGAGRFQLNLRRRTGREIPSAIIERADMLTMLSKNGRCQTVAFFHLNTKANFLEMKLPADAKLWSVLIDNQPVTPQRNGEQLLISLPSAPNPRRLLQVAFETMINAFDGFGKMKVEGPQLFVRADEGDATEPIPTADIEWRILPPEGYQLTNVKGAVSRERPERWAPWNWMREFSRAADPIQMLAQDVADSMAMATAVKEEAPMAAMDMEFAEDEAASEGFGGMGGGLGGGMGGLGSMDGSSPGGAGAERAMPNLANADSVPRPTTLRPNENRTVDSPENAPAEQPPSDPFGAPGQHAGASSGNALPVPRTASATRNGNANDDLNGNDSGGEGEQQTDGDSDGLLDMAAQFDDWGLAGLRSLPIDFQQTLSQSTASEAILFRGLGAEPELTGELVSQQRRDALAWSWGLLVFAIGVALTRASAAAKIRLIVLTSTLSIVAPLVVNEIDLIGPMGFCSFSAALALVVYYPIAAFLMWFTAAGKRYFEGDTARRATSAAASIAVIMFAANSASAQQPNVDWESLINRLANPAPVKIPKNAVIIPYRLEEGGDVRKAVKDADKVLVPYETYVNLWNRARPDQPISGPAPKETFIFAGAEYQATLGSEEQLLIRGRINIDVLTDQPVMVPLRLEGGVLSEALVDGRPARLSTVAPVAQPRQQAARAQPAAPQPVLALLLNGEGRKQVQLTIRLRPERQGGWRRIAVRLPGTVGGAVTVHVPNSGTEVRLRGVHDRELFETTKNAETITTALDMNQPLGLQWRPKIGQTQIDRTLTAQSTAVWDVQDEGLRLIWNISLSFRQGRRDAFTLRAPLDYLVEQVAGNNIRAWRVEREEDHQRIEVTLLKAVAQRSMFSLRLSKRGGIAKDDQPLTAPVVTAVDAALHQGTLYVRRSPMVDLRVVEQRGVSQTDVNEKSIAAIANRTSEGQSPLGVKSFQAFRFASTGYDVKVKADPVTADDYRIRARWQTLLHLSRAATRIETLAQFDAGNFTMHQVSVLVPVDMQVERVEAESLLDWSAVSEDGVQRLDLFFQTGQRGRFAVVVTGEIRGQPLAAPVKLPQLSVVDADQQSGQIVIKSDTGFQIQPRSLVGAQASPVRGANSPALRQVQNWLSPANRSQAQWVLNINDHVNYDGELVAEAKSPRVSATSVSNVRVTDQTIEESILLRFVVNNAGVRQLSFTLPNGLREARIQAPLVRRKMIEDIEGDDSRFRVRLDLQESVLGEIVVVVQHDRLHDGAKQSAPIPTIDQASASTLQQYVTLENASRDELVIETQTGVEPLGRRTPPPELQGVTLNRAFAVRDNPQLEYASKKRTTVTTAGARIELSEAKLAVDDAGVYRGEQVYHIDNRTEQFLEVELPASARLWTAIVAGEPVKPAKSVTSDLHVRIPLVKTAVGDPNYTIRLQYGGQLARLQWSRIEFPLIRTANVNVELSQVRLFLPKSHHWGRFGGSTMRQVTDERDFVRGYATYVRQQIGKATEALASKDAYRRARAKNNLKQLALSMENNRYAEGRYKAEFEGNYRALREAEEQAEAIEALPTQLGDNRDRFQDFYDSQSNDIETGKADKLRYNFGKEVVQQFNKPTAKGKGFDDAWLSRNNLGGKDNKPKDERRKQRIVVDEKANQSKVDLITRGNMLGKKLSGQLKVPAKPPASRRTSRQSALSNEELAQEYSRRLEQNSAPSQSFSSRSGGGGRGGQGQVPAFGTSPSNSLFSQNQRGQAESSEGQQGRPQSQQQLEQLQVLNDNLNSDITGFSLANQDGFVVVPTSGEMASLDVMLPMRGVEFRFTTPRDGGEITGYGLSRSIVWRMCSIAAVLGALIGWLAIQRVGKRLVRLAAGA